MALERVPQRFDFVEVGRVWGKEQQATRSIPPEPGSHTTSEHDEKKRYPESRPVPFSGEELSAARIKLPLTGCHSSPETLMERAPAHNIGRQSRKCVACDVPGVEPNSGCLCGSSQRHNSKLLQCPLHPHKPDLQVRCTSGAMCFTCWRNSARRSSLRSA